MSGSYGINVRMTIYGESHGKSIGLIIDGMPPGIYLDLDEIQRELKRRAPGKDNLSTPRKESDDFEIQSGFFNGYTTGTPLCVMIKNSDQHSKDYSILQDKMRPGHADYAGQIHYHGFNDYRGGGHFSGRLTSPLVFIGAVAKQVLAKNGIKIGAHILSIGDVKEEKFDLLGCSDKIIDELSIKDFCVLDDQKGNAMQERILMAKKENNSVGGVIEAIALHVPVGLGEPYFDSLESRLSHVLFSIPAVKGVEFGTGFNITKLKGSEANDQLRYFDNKVISVTNHNGGINGGITNGMPIVLRVAIKPTPSISREQNTISLKEGKNTTLTIAGRHDPCIVQRAIPVIEAVVAWTIWDLFLESKKWN